MTINRIRRLSAQSEVSFGVNPITGNGSTMTYIPCIELGLLEDRKQILDTNYFTGRTFPTPPIAAQDGWSFTCTIPIIGLPTSAGDGEDPNSVGGGAANDWFDLILNHILGTEVDTGGDQVTGGSSTTTQIEVGTTPSPAWNEQDLICYYETGASTTSVDWKYIEDDAGAVSGSFQVGPAHGQAFQDNSIVYGVRHYRYNESGGGGSSLAFHYKLGDEEYILLGGRCTSASMSFATNDFGKMTLTFEGDTKTDDEAGNYDNVPTPTSPATTPIVTLGSQCRLVSSDYTVSTIEVDFGITASSEMSTEATSGRSDFRSHQIHPVVTIHPLREDGLTQLKRAAGDTGKLLIQIGSGVDNSGSPVNSCCIYAPAVSVVEAAEENDNETLRQAVQCRVVDEVTDPGTESSIPFQFARA